MKRLLSLLLAVMLVMALAAPVFADNYGHTETGEDGEPTYTIGETTTGTYTTLNKYLITDSGATVPDVTFTYTVSVPDSVGTETAAQLKLAVPANAEAGTLPVYVGLNPELVKVNTTAESGTVKFNGNDTAITTTDDNIEFDAETQQYTAKPITLDFSGVTFTEPGIYRYYLTETGDSNLVEYDTQVSNTANAGYRTVDVYVFDDEGKTQNDLYIGTYVVYEGKVTTAPKADISDYETEIDPTTIQLDELGDDQTVANYPWTYTDGNYIYIYTYNDEGRWVETKKTVDDIEIYVDEYSSENLLRSAASDVKPGFEVKTIGELKTAAANYDAMATSIQGKKWYVKSALDEGLVLSYTWDSTEQHWDVTGRDTGSVDQPAADAKAIENSNGETVDGITVLTIKNGEPATTTTENYTYAEAQGKNITNAVLQGYVWQYQTKGPKTGLPTTFTYTYNSETGKWDFVAEVNGSAEYSAIPDDAYLNGDSITVTNVYYSYVLTQMNAYNAALQLNPNGAEAAGAVKNNVFVNEYETANLTLKKTVAGNQGSRDQYFEFIVTLYRDNISGNLKVSLGDSDFDEYPTVNGATAYAAEDMIGANSILSNGVTFTDENNDGTYTAKFTVYLQDGQSITLADLPTGTRYSITETDANQNGYTTTATVKRSSTSNEPVAYEYDDDDASIITIKQGDHEVEFTNTKNGVIPTGVAIGFGGAVVLLALAAGYFVLRRKLSV